MVEVPDAHIFNAKIIDDKTKLNWPPFAFPKAWCHSGFIVTLLF
jgi:hypothetical protein